MIHFPEDILVQGATDPVEVRTAGLITCHAVGMGAVAGSGEAALYLIHNYADETKSTLARLKRATAFLAGAGYTVAAAAMLGPRDSVLETSRFTAANSFESVASPAIREVLARAGVEPVVHTYEQSLTTNGLSVAFRPSDEQAAFVLTVR
jgi:hypothetical protein